MKVHLSKDPKEVQEGMNGLSSRGNRLCKGLEAAAYLACSRPSKAASRVSKGRGRGEADEVRGVTLCECTCLLTTARKEEGLFSG